MTAPTLRERIEKAVPDEEFQSKCLACGDTFTLRTKAEKFRAAVEALVREFAAEQLREAAAWAHVRALADPVMIGGPGPIVDGFGLTRNELLRRADALEKGKGE